MPIYEYHCSACGQDFEVIQKITDNPLRKCQKCGKMKAKRTISQTSFILKGSGWYVTDYAAGRSKSKSDSSSGNGKTDGKSSDSSDKPAKTDSEESKTSASPKKKDKSSTAKEATT